MEKLFVRLAVALLTFALGVGCVTLLLVKKRHSSFAIIEVNVPVSSQSVRTESVDEISPEAYAVYSAMLGGAARKQKINLFLVAESTIQGTRVNDESSKNMFEEMRREHPDLSSETTESFVAKNEKPYPLSPKFKTDFAVMLVNRTEEEKFFNERYELFKDGKKIKVKFKDTDGVCSFSRVGFNRERTQALVYKDYICGVLCGGGGY